MLRAHLLQSGVTLPEMLVGIFIFGTLTLAILGLATLGTRTALVNEQKTVAQAIANQRAELVRITPYNDVGFNDGTLPDGIFTPTEQVTRNDQSYEVNMRIELVDDPENGTLGEAITETNADYKQVFIEVLPPSIASTQQATQVSVISLPAGESCQESLDCGYGLGKVCCDGGCYDMCTPGDCPTGYVCAENGCGCIPEECNDSSDCSAEVECDINPPETAGICPPPPCDQHEDCPAGQQCHQEGEEKDTCQPPCQNNSECPSGNQCLNGTCIKEPPPECPPGSTDCCTDASQCPSGHACNPGTDTCVPECTSGASCPSGVCTSGFCQPDTCTSTSQCTGAGVACGPNGQCIPLTSCTSGSCPSGQTCTGGSCVPSVSCTSNSNCAGNYFCNTSTGQCQSNTPTPPPPSSPGVCPASFPLTSCIGGVIIHVSFVPVGGVMGCLPFPMPVACVPPGPPGGGGGIGGPGGPTGAWCDRSDPTPPSIPGSLDCGNPSIGIIEASTCGVLAPACTATNYLTSVPCSGPTDCDAIPGGQCDATVGMCVGCPPGKTCPGPGQVCIDGTVSNACTTTADCPAGKGCSNGGCVSLFCPNPIGNPGGQVDPALCANNTNKLCPPRSSDSCTGTDVCDASGVCLEVGCDSRFDCGPGQVCSPGGVCQQNAGSCAACGNETYSGTDCSGNPISVTAPVRTSCCYGFDKDGCHAAGLRCSTSTGDPGVCTQSASRAGSCEHYYCQAHACPSTPPPPLPTLPPPGSSPTVSPSPSASATPSATLTPTPTPSPTPSVILSTPTP